MRQRQPDDDDEGEAYKYPDDLPLLSNPNFLFGVTVHSPRQSMPVPVCMMAMVNMPIPRLLHTAMATVARDRGVQSGPCMVRVGGGPQK